MQNLWLKTMCFDQENLYQGFGNKFLGSDIDLLAVECGVLRAQIHEINQVHGGRCLVISSSDILSDHQADAMLTSEFGQILVVKTADCVPLLLLNRSQAVVGVIHAGYRGILADVISNTFHMASRVYGVNGSEFEVMLGPHIQVQNYEVGADLAHIFAKRYADENVIFKTGSKFYLDLNKVVLAELQMCGVEQFFSSPVCTFASSDFYSYRREGVNAGRQMSFIGWR